MKSEITVRNYNYGDSALNYPLAPAAAGFGGVRCQLSALSP
jgi:hypothetical protein